MCREENMNKILTAGAALMLTTSMASAGGIDRGGNDYSVLFEHGNFAQLSFSSVSPTVSGDYIALLGGGSTGDMANDYVTAGIALKYQLNDQIAIAFFLNQPYGADAEYSSGFYTGLQAKWTSTATSLVAKYNATPAVSVYGGVRYVQSSATINIPPLLMSSGATTNASYNYSASTNTDSQMSYILGAAYEKPEIALRVALTYESGFTHSFQSSETFPAGALSNFAGTTTIQMPSALTLDFQTGVAANTLVFGSIRYSDWSVWDVTPPGYYGVASDSITSIDNPVTTYKIGIGRKINDEFSVFARLGYEKANGGVASRLAPTDGMKSIGVGGSYTVGNVKITGGLEYAMLGDAVDGSGTSFTGSNALGVGINVGVNF